MVAAYNQVSINFSSGILEEIFPCVSNLLETNTFVSIYCYSSLSPSFLWGSFFLL